jgi:hypothetical protein
MARGLTDGLVVGVEMSEFSVAAARERYADLAIDWMSADASDVAHVRRHLGATAQKITLLLIDVSGSRDPGFVLTLAHKYARYFPSIRLILDGKQRASGRSLESSASPESAAAGATPTAGGGESDNHDTLESD